MNIKQLFFSQKSLYHYFDNNFSSKKITIVSLDTRKNELVDLHNNNVNNYAMKHNYKYNFYDNLIENKNKNFPVYWLKLILIKELMEKENDDDYFLWLDTDAMIIDDDVPIETLINLSPDSSIFIGCDFFTDILPFTKIYCAGVFLLKNDTISYQFINQCLLNFEKNTFCKDSNNNYILNGSWAGECYEQGVMNQILKTNEYFQKYLFTIPNEFVSNTHLPAFGVVILHMFDRNKDKITKTFANFLKNKN